MEEKILAFAVAMFVLSQIAERIANLFKLYFHDRIIVKFFKNTPKIGLGYYEEKNFSDSNSEKLSKKKLRKMNLLEKKRERLILLYSILSGFICTILFMIFIKDVDSISVEQEFLKSLFYNDKNYLKLNIAGIIGISIFLSFGSKFWHDILDIIYLFKNAKRNLFGNDSYLKADSTKELEERLAQSQSMINRLAREDFKNKLKDIEGVVAVCLETDKETKKENIIVHVEDEATKNKVDKLGKEVFVDEFGDAHNFDVLPVVTGKIYAQAEIGNSIINPDNKFYGTLGYIFEHNNKKYALTCYHVVIPNALEDWIEKKYSGNTEKIEQYKQTLEIGTLIWGVRNNTLDLAIIELNSKHKHNLTDSLHNQYPFENLPNIKDVFVKNQKGEEIRASLSAKKVSEVVVNYNNDTNKFDDLFTITKNKHAPTVQGDSGALVYSLTGNNKIHTIYGIVIGADNCYTYCMKMSNILEIIKNKI